MFWRILGCHLVSGDSFLVFKGLNGFDCVCCVGRSVPVQARDHRERRSKLLSAENTQRDYALAA